MGSGNLHAKCHPNRGPWRQLHGTACKGYFQETHGTLFHGKRVAPDLLVWAVDVLAEGLGIRAVARVFEVDPNTVLQWLVEAADHLKAFSQSVLHTVRVTQVQRDDLYALLSAVKDGKVSEAKGRPGVRYGVGARGRWKRPFEFPILPRGEEQEDVDGLPGA